MMSKSNAQYVEKGIPQRNFTLGEAAYYCHFSTVKFKRECPVVPSFFGDEQGLYDKKLIDEWLDKRNPVANNNKNWIDKLE